MRHSSVYHLRNSIVPAVAVFMTAVFPAILHAQDQQPDPLLAAYQKEFVFLDNEIRLLQDRIQEVKRDGESRVSKAEKELQDLQAELLAITSRVDRRSEDLRIVEEQGSQADDATDTLYAILTQASERLDTFGVPPFDIDTARKSGAGEQELVIMELEYGFERSFELLADLGTVRTEEGSFFLTDGTQVEGRIVHIGRVASFGINEQNAGTLAPAGGGRLKVVRTGSADIARKIAGGGIPETLPIYLYESLDSSAQTESEKTFRDTIEGGGIIGIVIICIGGISLFLIILRVVILTTVSRNNGKVIEEVAGHVGTGSYQDAEQSGSRIPGAMGRIVTATVRALRLDPDKAEDVVAESVLNEQPKLERFRSAISVFAAVAPLLGLLGTVTGMIATFDIITIHGTGDPKLLSGGISEALITTELGLMVAIPTLLIGNLLASWSDRITSGMEVTALRLINIACGYDRNRAMG